MCLSHVASRVRSAVRLRVRDGPVTELLRRMAFSIKRRLTRLFLPSYGMISLTCSAGWSWWLSCPISSAVFAVGHACAATGPGQRSPPRRTRALWVIYSQQRRQIVGIKVRRSFSVAWLVVRGQLDVRCVTQSARQIAPDSAGPQQAYSVPLSSRCSLEGMSVAAGLAVDVVAVG